MPTSRKRSARGSCTAQVVASAKAKAVPGIAQGIAISHSSSPPSRRPALWAARAAPSPRATASPVAAAAIQSELTIGRSRSAPAPSSR